MVCTKCYFKTDVSAALTIDTTKPLNQTFSTFTAAVKDELVNVTEAFVQWGKDTISSSVDFLNAAFDPDISTDDLDFPDLDVDFNIDIPTSTLPKTNLRINFDNLDIYLQMAMKLGAGVTYTIPLIPPAGMGIGQSSNLYMGAIVALELILTAEDDVELTSGLHITLDNDAYLELELFGKNVTSSSL